MCCSLLQSVTVCCSQIADALGHGSVLLHFAACCSVLQRVAVCCSQISDVMGHGRPQTESDRPRQREYDMAVRMRRRKK